MICNRRTQYVAGGGLSVRMWLLIQLVLAGVSVFAGADELVAEIHLRPLPGQPEPSQNGFEPLWQLSPDGGSVYGVVVDSEFLVIARSRRPEVQLVSPQVPLVLSLSGENVEQAWLAVPVGAMMLVEGSTGRALTVQIERAGELLAEPIIVESGQQLPLPVELMTEPGWLGVRALETGQQIQILKVDSAFLTGQSRLMGSGRLVIEFEGEIVHSGAPELELSLSLWFRGRELCAPDAESTTCDWLLAGNVGDGKVVLDPIALDDSEWSLRPEDP